MGPDKQQIILQITDYLCISTTILKASVLFHCHFMIIKQTLREVASKVFNFFVWFVLFCLCWPKLAELAVNTTGMSLFLCWLQEQAYLCIKYIGCQGLRAFILSRVWRLPVFIKNMQLTFFFLSFFWLLKKFEKSNGTPAVLLLTVFPRTPEHDRMPQLHQGGGRQVLLQQLDDSAIPAAPAAVHPAQLHPLPEVSGWVSVLLFLCAFWKNIPFPHPLKKYFELNLL